MLQRNTRDQWADDPHDSPRVALYRPPPKIREATLSRRNVLKFLLGASIGAAGVETYTNAVRQRQEDERGSLQVDLILKRCDVAGQILVLHEQGMVGPDTVAAVEGDLLAHYALLLALEKNLNPTMQVPPEAQMILLDEMNVRQAEVNVSSLGSMSENKKVVHILRLKVEEMLARLRAVLIVPAGPAEPLPADPNDLDLEKMLKLHFT